MSVTPTRKGVAFHEMTALTQYCTRSCYLLQYTSYITQCTYLYKLHTTRVSLSSVIMEYSPLKTIKQRSLTYYYGMLTHDPGGYKNRYRHVYGTLCTCAVHAVYTPSFCLDHIRSYTV